MSIITKSSALIPHNVDLSKWAVVACDQFSAEPKYWQQLANYIGDAPSTLGLVYPEAYLGRTPAQDAINSIIHTMNTYEQQNMFSAPLEAVLVERQTSFGVRAGIVIAADLDCYNWEHTHAPIRATEETMLDRLAIRVDIRKRAIFETPHTLLLIDDVDRHIIEPIYHNRSQLTKLYDFNLNMSGGRITGYRLDDISDLIAKIESLASRDLQISKYGVDTGLVLAVGDGNHSMAAAKVYWDSIRQSLSEKERANHPSRYFLAEIVNIYGDGMEFQPIHRMVFGAGSDFITGLKSELSGDGIARILTHDGDISISVPAIQSEAISQIQKYLEKATMLNPNMRIEYVHNEDHLRSVLAANEGVAISMPHFPKNELFSYVANNGCLPKKAFSIGEPESKRYYLECRRIR
ncbi:MAG: DUF1015 domain-containing protein [Christensenellaceae bacterium]|jgi:hypothetical protein|nr:DUF1015 domain-containing protein [Christensenellaceae bacterium]